MIEYNKKELSEAVKISKTFREVLVRFERNDSTKSYKTLKSLIKKWNIDSSHFLSKSEYIKNMFSNGQLLRRYDEEIFCKNSLVSRSTLKRRIIENDLIEYVCKECGQDESWNGKKISLILDHINGVRNDNRIENLRFLCPNCNATLPTHCRGKSGLKEKKKFDKRKIKRPYKPRLNYRKVKNRPTKDEMLEMLETMSYCAIGRKYDISDTAVRKWAKNYNIL